MYLEMSGVSKVYRGGVHAVRDLTLGVGAGVLGLLGPNGAGKSSLMRILATITRPTGGQVRWDGTDIVAEPDRLRRTLGYLPQNFGVYPHLTAPEFLAYLAAVKGLSPHPARARVDELLALVNLTDVRRRPLGKYSGGMRQRIGIAQALLNDPRLLIVDEPTVGLDPEEQLRFRNLLAELATDRVVILSTHTVSDVEAIADRIAVMAGGQLRRLDTVERLLREVAGSVWEVLVASADLPRFRERHLTSRTVHTPDGVRVRVLDDVMPAAGAVQIEPELEDAYLWVVRGRDRAATASMEGGTV